MSKLDEDCGRDARLTLPLISDKRMPWINAFHDSRHLSIQDSVLPAVSGSLVAADRPNPSSSLRIVDRRMDRDQRASFPHGSILHQRMGSGYSTPFGINDILKSATRTGDRFSLATEDMNVGLWMDDPFESSSGFPQSVRDSSPGDLEADGRITLPPGIQPSLASKLIISWTSPTGISDDIPISVTCVICINW